MDYGALPPEINSARMYAGAGPASLLSSADAWQDLATELNSAAASYSSVITGLTSGTWLGTSAVTMAAAAGPYVTWLSATGSQAEQAAAQLTAAVTAYESAYAATVPPALIAANRSLQEGLIATNLLGQNTAAIAAAEAQYLQMWAQDAAAMYGYAGASAMATQVTAFSSPPQTVAQPATATTAGAGTSTDAETLMSQGPQLLSTTPAALQALATPTEEATTGGSASSMSSLNSLMMPMRMAMMPMSMLMRMLMGGSNGVKAGALGAAGAAAASGVAGGAAGTVTLTGFSGASAATAGLGRTASIGALSVPPAWTGLGVASAPVTTALPSVGAAAAPAAGMTNAAAVPPMVPFGSLAARGGVGGSPTHYDFRPTVIPRSPAAG